eukprot:scaffold51715_cov30-Phaeocystis_antarctica.AAC.2
MIDTPDFSRRNRDLGTISVYVGYRDVRCVPPLSVHIWSQIPNSSPRDRTEKPVASPGHPPTFAEFGPGPGWRVFRRPPGAAAGVAPASSDREGGRAACRACPQSRRSSKWPA